MKWRGEMIALDWAGRTPQGVRGLKSAWLYTAEEIEAVAPRKGCVD